MSELSDDMEARLMMEARVANAAKYVQVTIDAKDLRALLLAYQERGRALERLASSEAFDLPQAIDGPLAQEMRMRLDYARATLKGKSHDH